MISILQITAPFPGVVKQFVHLLHLRNDECCGAVYSEQVMVRDGCLNGFPVAVELAALYMLIVATVCF